MVSIDRREGTTGTLLQAIDGAPDNLNNQRPEGPHVLSSTRMATITTRCLLNMSYCSENYVFVMFKFHFFQIDRCQCSPVIEWKPNSSCHGGHIGKVTTPIFR